MPRKLTDPVTSAQAVFDAARTAHADALKQLDALKADAARLDALAHSPNVEDVPAAIGAASAAQRAVADTAAVASVYAGRERQARDALNAALLAKAQDGQAAAMKDAEAAAAQVLQLVSQAAATIEPALTALANHQGAARAAERQVHKLGGKPRPDADLPPPLRRLDDSPLRLLAAAASWLADAPHREQEAKTNAERMARQRERDREAQRRAGVFGPEAQAKQVAEDRAGLKAWYGAGRGSAIPGDRSVRRASGVMPDVDEGE